MDDAVPDRSREDRDALSAAEQAMEEHEIELFAVLLLYARTVDLPGDGTESERLAALTEIVRGDPEALDLYMRLKLIQHFGGGNYISSLLELRGQSPDQGA